MPILALDVGDRRIGLATSDPSETFALPVGVIERSALREDLAEIVRVASERAADTIVVGDPVRLSGERGIAAEKIDRFCAALERVYTGTIARVDERLTTAQASKALIAADVSRAKRKKVVDGIAAALILDTYLARRAARSR
jgi:putative Holliday junction resolvase